MTLRVVPEGKVVLKDTHTMYIVDNNGSVSEVEESAQAKIRGIKFCGKREYNGRYKKEVTAMKGKPLIFMTMQEIYAALFSKNKTSLPRNFNVFSIQYETFIIAKKSDENKGETNAN
jgi:hypothetical protein